ncbi:cytidine deaminase family protein [Treponema primitia]|uniref:cytidine deaminase family protein n=1 Tax=Treponema primitia TaxID=88058 RepID=UPI0002554DE9|nr:cytidine deaminase [Treponema primitia]
MKEIGFKELYKIAMSKNNPRKISPFIEAGEVSAAILTENGNVYTGVCIDTASTLGMCAERNAIANMITNGESKIIKLVCCFSDGRIGSPCGACREYLMQLDKDSGNIEILINYEKMEIIKLKDIIPMWWGDEKFK